MGGSRILSGLGFLSIVLFLLAGRASAQFPVYEGCFDIRGIPVASVMNTAIDDIAKAANLPPKGMPVIFYNPWVLANVQPQTRVFFYAHECGHHALGHNFGLSHPLMVEQEADCFAVRTLYGNGTFDDDDLSVVQGDLASFGRADWTHLPGPQRAINLLGCLGQ